VVKTSASRVVLQRREYEPYGKQLTPALESGPGYTGHDTDPDTWNTYMQQRYYDPRVARFWSVDPVTVSSVGGNFNRYWYGNNNPYRFTDPDGRQVSDSARATCDIECKRREQERRRRERDSPFTGGGMQLRSADAQNVAGATISAAGTSATLMEGTVMVVQGGTKAAEGAQTLEAANVLAKAKLIGRSAGAIGGILGLHEALTGDTPADRAHGALNVALTAAGAIACNAACGVGLAIYGAADAAVQFKTYTDPQTGEVTTGWTALWRDIRD
jgi:RHS repeat-associated protein